MNRRWRGLVIILVAAAAAAGIYWWLLPKGTDEQQIREVIVRLGEAIERQDVRGCMSLVSKDYHDSMGNTHSSLARLAIDAFRSTDRISVASYDPRVVVTGDEAAVTVDVRVEYQLASAGEPETVELSATLAFRREGWLRRWRIVKAEGWQDESGAGMSDYL